MSQYTIDNSPFSNNTNSFKVQNYYVADDRSPLLPWLSPLEPRLRHRDIQERRVDNVGGWLQTEEFGSWHDQSGEGEGGKAVLYCYGGRGSGGHLSSSRNHSRRRKESDSVLTGYRASSLVVDRLSDQSKGKNTALTCFYLEFPARKERSVASILGSLPRQVVSGMEKAPEEITRAPEEQKLANAGGDRNYRMS